MRNVMKCSAMLLLGAAYGPTVANAAALEAVSKSYPARPVRMVVSQSPGGANDLTIRLIGPLLSERLGQPVVIENRPGANGIIGTEIVKNAPPDGYTIQIVSNSTHGANASLFKKLPYDSIRDFEHVGLFGTFGSVAVVPPDSPIKTLADLTTFAKANPGKTFYGHFNSASHVGGALFALRSGAPIEGVPYKALGNALADLYGKQISVIFLDYVASTSHIASGKLIPLGVTARERHKVWPNVPAIAETYPGFDQIVYLGLATPAGVPADILNTLHRHVVGAVTDPAIRSRLEGLGIVISTPSRDEYNRFVRDQLDRWAVYVRDAKIQPE